jgi:hypothetical protein
VSSVPQPLSHSRVLRVKMELARGPLHEAFTHLQEQPDLARRVPGLLLLLHQIMRASVPLMEAAWRLTRERADADPVCAGLSRYYEAHIEEERHHDLWMLEDLELLGVSRAEALARIPSPTVASMVGGQYYWLHHHHPVGLLGYIAVLEGYPPSEVLLQEVQARSGLPEAAFRTCRKHGELDPEHQRELDALLDSLPLTQAHTALLGLSSTHTLLTFARCVEELAPLA